MYIVLSGGLFTFHRNLCSAYKHLLDYQLSSLISHPTMPRPIPIHFSPSTQATMPRLMSNHTSFCSLTNTHTHTHTQHSLLCRTNQTSLCVWWLCVCVCVGVCVCDHHQGGCGKQDFTLSHTQEFLLTWSRTAKAAAEMVVASSMGMSALGNFFMTMS